MFIVFSCTIMSLVLLKWSKMRGNFIIGNSVSSSVLLIVMFCIGTWATNTSRNSYDDVNLVVRSNSPVVIGSVATFHASLYNLTHRNAHNEGFVYVWINNAANRSTGYFDIMTTAAGKTAKMSKLFSKNAQPGKYLMEVRVYRKPDVRLMAFEQLRPVAVGYHNFTLTERNMGTTSVPAYLPLFSIIIAISAFSAVLGSYFYRRRDPTDDVEEANFEFYHMTIQGLNYRQQDPVTIKMVARKAKRAWGFWRARAHRKMKNVLWCSAPACDENEMQDVTERLLPGMRSYDTSGVTIIDS